MDYTALLDMMLGLIDVLDAYRGVMIELKAALEDGNTRLALAKANTVIDSMEYVVNGLREIWPQQQ